MQKFTILATIGAVMIATATSSALSAEPDKLAGVAEKMQSYIDKKEIPGAVTLVANRDKVLHLDATGLADMGAGTPLKTDSIFWIASMTKPVTGTAVMMMVQEGKLSIEDPIGKYLPELAHLKMADGTEKPVTIHQLLTHSSGMGEISADEAKGCHTLADAATLYATKPLQFEPGSKWSYCQSGINTAARIVEVVSGQTFPEFLEKRLFGPLGMKDTTFYLSDKQLARLAKSYSRTQDGNLIESPNVILYGMSATSRYRFPAANGGLFSTASDYAKFCRMILNKGELNGKRYLRADLVEQMTTVQSGSLQTGFTPGNGWGLGWCVVREPQGVSAALGKGSHGHGGAYGTQAWIDPVNNLIYILMVQRANFPNSDASDVRRDFQQTAADALKPR